MERYNDGYENDERGSQRANSWSGEQERYGSQQEQDDWREGRGRATS